MFMWTRFKLSLKILQLISVLTLKIGGKKLANKEIKVDIIMGHSNQEHPLKLGLDDRRKVEICDRFHFSLSMQLYILIEMVFLFVCLFLIYLFTF